MKRLALLLIFVPVLARAGKHLQFSDLPDCPKPKQLQINRATESVSCEDASSPLPGNCQHGIGTANGVIFCMPAATSNSIVVNPTSGLVTSEGGGTATFSIVLGSQPSANVSIGLSSSDSTEGTVSPVSLTFTSENWFTPQTATVTGVNDDLIDGLVAYRVVTAAATSTDTGYSGLNAADVSVANIDNDTGGLGGGEIVTFGRTVEGGTLRGFPDAGNVKSCSQAAPTYNGTVSKLTARWAEARVGAHVKGLIYSVANGECAALLGASAEVIGIASGVWTDFMFASPVNVTSGTYYCLCIHSDMSINANAASGSGVSRFNSDTYADGPSDPFGTPSTSTYEKPIYATMVAEASFADVTTYGATGNGTTDDTAAFQAAANTKKPVRVPAPPGGQFYRTTQEILLYNSIQGDGSLPEIKNTDNQNTEWTDGVLRVDGYQGTGLTISGLKLTGTYVSGSGAEHQPNIFIVNSRNVTVEGSTLQTPWGDCVYAGGPNSGTVATTPQSRNITIRNNVCTNPRRSCFSLTHVDGGLIEKNTCTADGSQSGFTAGVDLEPNNAQSIWNVTISDNTFTIPYDNGISLFFAYDNAPGGNVVITNNGGDTQAGVFVTGNGLGKWSNVTQSGNAFY